MPNAQNNADKILHGLTPQALFRGDFHIDPDTGSMAFWKDYVFWLDLRTEEEKRFNRLAYAYDVPLHELPRNHIKAPERGYIIPFSGSTFRTGVAWFWLKNMGYKRVLALPTPIEKTLIELDVASMQQRGIPLGCCKEKLLDRFAVPKLNKDITMNKINVAIQELDFNFLGSGKHAVTERDFFNLLSDDNAFFLDVRTDEELGCSSYPWAHHIPVHQLPERIKELPKDKLIVPFCSSVFRASIAWAWLKDKGFDNVRTLTISTEAIATLLKPGSLFAQGEKLNIPSPAPQVASAQCCAGR